MNESAKNAGHDQPGDRHFLIKGDYMIMVDRNETGIVITPYKCKLVSFNKLPKDIVDEVNQVILSLMVSDPQESERK